MTASIEANKQRLPGDREKNSLLDRIIRVDHAGEYGAKRIYEGQLAILRGRSPNVKLIEEMKAQEIMHLEAFEGMLRERHGRPTALVPLWHVGGFLMGAVTAMMGEKAAMACTVAVESVIDEHYRKQEALLDDAEDAGLKTTIAQFRAEEMEHHATGLAHGAEDAPVYGLLHAAISGVTRGAIWLSTRL